MKTIYRAAATKSNYKGNIQFYPIVKFGSKVVSDSYYLNNPQETRSKALSVAKQYIKNLKD